MYKNLKQIGKYFYKKIQRREKDLNGFDFTVNKTLESSRELEKVKKLGVEAGNSSLHKSKNSDTIFILGSGPSIRHITNKQWYEIRKNDSVGFNFWFVHDFVPSFYIYQPEGEEFLSTHLKVLKEKKSMYKKIPFIMRTDNLNKLSQKELDSIKATIENYRVYLCSEVPIHSKCNIKPSKLIRFFERLGLLTYKNVKTLLPKIRSSIALIIAWAYQMGYRNIILCGIDLKGNDHFWDYEKYRKINEKYKLPKPGKADVNTFTDRTYNKVTMGDIILDMKEWMEKNNGVTLKVINKDTKLYPQIGTCNKFS